MRAAAGHYYASLELNVRTSAVDYYFSVSNNAHKCVVDESKMMNERTDWASHDPLSLCLLSALIITQRRT